MSETKLYKGLSVTKEPVDRFGSYRFRNHTSTRYQWVTVVGGLRVVSGTLSTLKKKAEEALQWQQDGQPEGYSGLLNRWIEKDLMN